MNIGGKVASLEYARRGSIVGLIYLFLPESPDYEEAGEALTKHALAYARANGLQVAPASPYTEEYVRTRRQYDDLLAPKHTWLHFLPMSARF